MGVYSQSQHAKKFIYKLFKDKGMDIEEKAKKVNKIASKPQKKVLADFQEGTEHLFLMYQTEPITKESIDRTLRLMVNNVEGDTSQLEEEHSRYAKNKGWLKEFE